MSTEALHLDGDDPTADDLGDGSSRRLRAGRIRQTAAGEDSIRISVSDTGMTPEVQAHIFERSFTTKGVDRGSGQGPAAHDAVAAHAGEIKIDSTVGMGTTFTIVLPLVPPEQEDAGDE